jgi:hypothetical protein
MVGGACFEVGAQLSARFNRAHRHEGPVAQPSRHCSRVFGIARIRDHRMGPLHRLRENFFHQDGEQLSAGQD